jgi:phosphopantothenoylcysteine synthetase/decarboxylase
VGCDRAFDRDDNALLLLWPSGKKTLALKSKAELAQEFVAFIADQVNARG